MNHKVLWPKERLDVYEAKIEESEKAGSRWELNPGHLTCVASALPLSYDNRTTANPHNPPLWLFVKVFSVKFRGVASVGSISEQSAKVFSLKSRKLSREKTLANFVVLRIFVKVFSVKFRGIVAIGLKPYGHGHCKTFIWHAVQRLLEWSFIYIGNIGTRAVTPCQAMARPFIHLTLSMFVLCGFVLVMVAEEKVYSIIIRKISTYAWMHHILCWYQLTTLSLWAYARKCSVKMIFSQRKKKFSYYVLV